MGYGNPGQSPAALVWCAALQAEVDLLNNPVPVVLPYVNFATGLVPDADDGPIRTCTITGDADLYPPSNGVEGMRWDCHFKATGGDHYLTWEGYIFPGYANPILLIQDIPYIFSIVFINGAWIFYHAHLIEYANLSPRVFSSPGDVPLAASPSLALSYHGHIISNVNDSTTKIVTLPPAIALPNSNIPYRIRGRVSAAFNLRFQTSGADVISQGAGVGTAGGYIQSGSPGAQIELINDELHKWVAAPLGPTNWYLS